MAKIEDYKFGVITVDGKDYKEDVLIGTSGKVAKRKTELSKNNHEFSKEEIKDLLENNSDAELVIIGTGKSGFAKVTSEAEKFCANKGVQLEVAPTDKAIDRFNWWQGKKKVAAIFHLTC